MGNRTSTARDEAASLLEDVVRREVGDLADRGLAVPFEAKAGPPSAAAWRAACDASGVTSYADFGVTLSAVEPVAPEEEADPVAACAASNAAVETDLIFTTSPFSTSHVRSISPFFTSSALRQPFGGASSRPSSSLSASTSHFNSPPPPGDRVPASSVTSANFIANDVSAALTSALSASLGGDGTFFRAKSNANASIHRFSLVNATRTRRTTPLRGTRRVSLHSFSLSLSRARSRAPR